MGTLLRSCVEVHELIKLSFGVVSGVGPGIYVLDRVHVPQGEGVVCPIDPPNVFNGVFCIRNVFDTCMKS